jgi:hypothetical protein
VVESSGPEVLEGIGIMNLAYGFVAQTLQTHDELVATRINEQHRNAAAERAERADRGERAGRRPNLAHRLGERLHGRDARDIRGARTAH